MTQDEVDEALAAVAGATERLTASARRLTEAELRGPSALPVWTRGHVLTHVARNGEALERLLRWAATGLETPQYASRQQRDSEIAYGATRPLDEQLDDLARVTDAFAARARAAPADRWGFRVRWLSGAEHEARHVLWARWREIEVHHVDLACGYDSADWPDDFSRRLLEEVVDGLSHRADAPDVLLEGRDTGRRFALGAAVGMAATEMADHGVQTVTGAEHRLAAWLTGRSDGRMLVVTPAGRLPAVPRWI